MNAARPGIHLWGACQTLAEKKLKRALGLKPVMRVRAPIRQIFKVPKGEGLGYGHRWICDRDTWVGTVCLGYADGISRQMSRKNSEPWKVGMVVRGAKVPVIGTVSMDLTMVDLTDHPEVENLAKSSEEWAYWISPEQSVEEVSDFLGTISYEIFCSLGHRLPRHESEAYTE